MIIFEYLNKLIRSHGLTCSQLSNSNARTDFRNNLLRYKGKFKRKKNALLLLLSDKKCVRKLSEPDLVPLI